MSARPFSWLGSALGAGVVNALINFAIGWFSIPEAGLPSWSVPGLSADVVATAFGISFGTGLVVTPLSRAELARGKVLPPSLPARVRESFARWPRSTVQRALNLGVLSVLGFAPLPLLALWALEIDAVTRASSLAFKTVFSFVQGALVTPPIAAAALVTAAALEPRGPSGGERV